MFSLGGEPVCSLFRTAPAGYSGREQGPEPGSVQARFRGEPGLLDNGKVRSRPSPMAQTAVPAVTLHHLLASSQTVLSLLITFWPDRPFCSSAPLRLFLSPGSWPLCPHCLTASSVSRSFSSLRRELGSALLGSPSLTALAGLGSPPLTATFIHHIHLTHHA